MTKGALLPTHGDIGPHVHLEALDAAGNYIETDRIPIPPNVESAKAQADFEYGIREEDWVDMRH